MNDAPTKIATTDQLKTAVSDTVQSQRIYDIHTHLFSPPFGELLLWGIDELLTYHYLIAELFRKSDITYDHFWHMTKTEQADLIWKTLFIENSPISEACRGVVTTLNELGLDVASNLVSPISPVSHTGSSIGSKGSFVIITLETLAFLKTVSMKSSTGVSAKYCRYS